MNPTIYRLTFETNEKGNEYEVYEEHRCQEKGCVWTDPNFIGKCPITNVDQYVKDFEENLIEGEVGQIEITDEYLTSRFNKEDLYQVTEKGIVRNYRLTDGNWEMLVAYNTEDGEVKEWCGCMAIDVSIDCLINTYEDLIAELWLKERDLLKLNEQYKVREFEIMYISDFDFKAEYGSTSEKVRKQHAKTELSDLNGQINSLELSVNWLKNYIPFLKELIWVKGRD